MVATVCIISAVAIYLTKESYRTNLASAGADESQQVAAAVGN
jgi:hypothetical protein